MKLAPLDSPVSEVHLDSLEMLVHKVPQPSQTERILKHMHLLIKVLIFFARLSWTSRIPRYDNMWLEDALYSPERVNWVCVSKKVLADLFDLNWRLNVEKSRMTFAKNNKSTRRKNISLACVEMSCLVWYVYKVVFTSPIFFSRWTRITW